MRLVPGIFVLLCVVSCGQQTSSDLSSSSLNAVNTALQGSNARVLGLQLTAGRTVVKLTGRFSETLEARVVDALRTVPGQVNHFKFDWDEKSTTQIQTRFDCAGAARVVYANPRTKPNSISGAKIMLNPGHGYTQLATGNWKYQRPIPPSDGAFLHEDPNNLEMAVPMASALTVVGSLVSSVRDLNLNTSVGISGLETWKEAARHHVQALGVPDHVWNSEGNKLNNDCNQGRDIRVRPFYANYLGVDALIGLHSNASVDSSIRGTRVYYNTEAFTNDIPNESLVQSIDLARDLGNSIVTAIRQDRADLNWGDPIFVGSNQYGETGYAKMPAIIIEVGFHTNPVDAAAMTDPIFRTTLARGIKNGLEQFFGPAIPIPNVPTGLTAAMSSNGRMFLSWLEVGNAEKYKFSATFDGQPVQISGDVPHGLESRGGAVVTFQSNPSPPELQGHEVCFAIQSVNLGGMSTISSSECLPYVFYSNGSLQNTKIPLPKLTIVHP
jgi:N-acetylmuramoyl-L-alanine amidase